MIHLIGLVFLLLVGCVNQPTKVVENIVVDQAAPVPKLPIVLIDTRPAFEYETYHIAGSVRLSSEDFLILKNPSTKSKIFDPDLEQTIERLARRGVSPNVEVLLLSNFADSDELKKWTWLLSSLQIKKVSKKTLSEYRAQRPNLAPLPQPERQKVWKVANKAKILKDAPNCFVNYSAVCIN